jgi:hypothetical protein
VLKQQKPVGKPSRLTPQAWEGLLQAMRAGHIATMQDARNDLECEWAISYKNGKEHGWLFRETPGQVEDRAPVTPDDIRKPVLSTRPPFKKLRELGQSTSREAGRGLR